MYKEIIMDNFDEKELAHLKVWCDFMISSTEEAIKLSNQEGDREFLEFFKLAYEEYKELIKSKKFTSSELRVRFHGDVLLEMEKRNLKPLE